MKAAPFWFRAKGGSLRMYSPDILTARCYGCALCVRAEIKYTQGLRRARRAAKALRMNCFVINLDRSPNRLALVREQLTCLGLAWERVPAVDGSTFSLPDHRVVDE